MKFKIVRKVGILGILTNFFLFVIKFVVGLIFKSQSMMADSFNSISDVSASLMTFIGNKIASNERDEDHNFGHEKAEYIFSMFISISIFLISIKLLYDSFKSLIVGNKIIFSYKLVLVSLITIVLKLILYLYTKYLYKKENNILLKSFNLDSRNDIILTSGVLVSIILSKYNIYYVDSLVGIVISIWFLIGGINIFKESFNVLMDVSLDINTKNKIIDMILKDKDIIRIDDIHSIAIGYKFIIVLKLCVDGNLNTFKSHEIANHIEEMIIKNFSNVAEVFVHVNPL